MNRIILGTANFGSSYKGYTVSKGNAFDIMFQAQHFGVHWIETAVDYGKAISFIADFEKATGTRFRIILKGDTERSLRGAEAILGREADILMWHHGKPKDKLWWKRVQGASIYERWEYRQAMIARLGYVEFPISAMDTKFTYLRHHPGVVHIARSVFAGGEPFRYPQLHGYPSMVEIFWNSVITNPLVDYVCVGIDTPGQLSQLCAMRPFEVRYTREGINCAPLETPLPKVMLPHDERGN